MQVPAFRRAVQSRSASARFGLVALTIAVLLGGFTACGSDAADRASTTTVAKGENADAASGGGGAGGSCSVALNAQAVVPGQASTERVAAVEGIDPTLVKDAETIAEGIKAVKSGPGALIGWAFNTLAGSSEPSDPDKERLEEISNRLDQISAQLKDLEAQLAQITNLIKDTTYIDAVKALTDDHVAPILSTWQQYCDVVSSQDTDPATIAKLSDSILDPATGIRPHVTAIVETMEGSTLTGNVPLPGMFSEFVKDQKKPDEFDDQGMYSSSIDPFTDYFANLTVMGLMLMTEAWHAKGNTTEAQATLNDLWADTRAVYQAGGHPLSDDQVVLQTTTGKVWTRSATCPKATFASSAAGGHESDADPVQATLARNVAFVAANPPSPPVDYAFQAGDAVCSFQVSLGWPTLLNFEEALIDQSGLPTSWVRAGSADPSLVWRLPAKTDLDALLANRGSATPEAYLNQSGFTVPAKGVAGSPYLATSELANGITWFDTTANSYQSACIVSGEPNCSGAHATLGHSFLADAACRLGAADYPGVYTACGKDWLDQRWPASPPPPGS